ncbi:MAG: porin [Paludibacter sp.]|nr:porin [Paludibacter sp.]
MKRAIKPIAFVCVFIFSSIQLKAQTSYEPQIDGTIRAKYEYNTNDAEHRFQVRNARFSIRGNFSPIVNYKAEIDLSDEGATKMLDAYLRLQPSKWWHFTIGQQKVPFSTDNLRSPHQLYFANRSFIGKQLTGLRDVGATFEFENFTEFPLSFQAGVYNGTGLYNQKSWRKTNELSYVLRSVIRPVKSLELSVDVNSINPSGLRMNLYSGGIMYDIENLHLESEYFYKTYENNLYTPTQGFFGFAAYNIATPKSKNITKITPGIRYDMMTENKKFDSAGTLIAPDIARSRITGGITISLAKPFLNDIRLNYEQYFYGVGIPNSDNKFVAEFVVRF